MHQCRLRSLFGDGSAGSIDGVLGIGSWRSSSSHGAAHIPLGIGLVVIAELVRSAAQLVGADGAHECVTVASGPLSVVGRLVRLMTCLI